MLRQMSKQATKRGQAWSFDLLLAGGLFILAFVLFYYIISLQANPNDIRSLRLEGDLISKKIVSSDLDETSETAFIIENKIDETKLKNLSDMNYSELKSEFGVVNDFCIFIIDEDGNLVNISSITGDPTSVGIGDPNVNISGIPCG